MSTALIPPPSSGGGGGIADDDPRLSNARTPTHHAATHTEGGVDEVTVTSAQISDLANFIADAIVDLNLDTASTHPATDFVLQSALSAAISSGIASWVGAAPSNLNEILELVAQFTTDEAVVSALTTTVAGKLAKASNLSDVADAAAARSNLLAAPSLNTTAVKTSAYTAAANDLVPVDTTSGAVTVTLPNAPADGSRVCVKHVIQGSTNAVTINCAGSDVFNKTGGSTSATLPMLAQAMQFQYKASTHIWYITADDQPLSQTDLRYVKRTDPGYGVPDTNMTNLSTVRFFGILNHTGPPVAGDLTSGTFPAGGSVLDSTGQEWVCLSAGSPGTWVATGSGKILAGPVTFTSAFQMTTAATAEDIPGMSLSVVYDGRPIGIVCTPANVRSDVAGKLITIFLKRSSDSITQTEIFKETNTAVANVADSMSPIMLGPITAWPSDGAAFVVGTTYTFKLTMTAAASTKGTFAGSSSPSIPVLFYAVAM